MHQVLPSAYSDCTRAQWLNKENLESALLVVVALSALAAIGLCTAGYLGLYPLCHLPLHAVISINVGAGIVVLTSLVALYILRKHKPCKDLRPTTPPYAENLYPLDIIST